LGVSRQIPRHMDGPSGRGVEPASEEAGQLPILQLWQNGGSVIQNGL